jgi:hypothetical protein
MIDPNMLLNNFRNALASGHPNMALLAMATMDEQLSLGGELPDDWGAVLQAAAERNSVAHPNPEEPK